MRRFIPFVVAIGFATFTMDMANVAHADFLPKIAVVRRPVRAASQAQLNAIWTVPKLCAAYKFPKGLTGGGVIGIAEYGGGYLKTDLQEFSMKYMNGVPINISDVSVDGAINNPGSGSDLEVTLDIEIAAAAYYYCTGKSPTIKVFFHQGSAASYDALIDGFTAVVSAAAAAGCDVLSISWGFPEGFASNSATTRLEAAATAATVKGMATFVSTGDNDADSGFGDRLNHLSLPASAPHVIAVGGTSKNTTSEVVWNNGLLLGFPAVGTGGGYSKTYPTQTWQIGAPAAPTGNNGKGRMIPDVAANADPFTGYELVFQGQVVNGIGGTSASCPLWAGLFSTFPTGGRKLGFIAPTLWLPANRNAFLDITQGNNVGQGVGFSAAVGPDACTGLGVPVGTALYTVFNPVVVPPTPPPVPSNVTVAYASGRLTITGDLNANSLTVSLQAGTIRVEGANSTSINKSTSPFIVSVSGPLTLAVDMGAGDDGIQFIGVGATSANVQMGAGADKAAFTLSNIGTLTIDGGTGTDILITTSSTFATLSESNIP